MSKGKIIMIIIFSFLGLFVLGSLVELGTGWFGVYKTKTVEKAQKDAEREVFEETQSYVEAKRQEALKFYQEYQKADHSEKLGIKQMVSHSFANFDEEKLNEPLRSFVRDCKYNQ